MLAAHGQTELSDGNDRQLLNQPAYPRVQCRLPFHGMGCMSRVIRAGSCSKVLAGPGQIDGYASRERYRLPAAESGCLSRLRVGGRASHKLESGAATVGVWNVGSQHEAEL
jgi:hypothetical protein